MKTVKLIGIILISFFIYFYINSLRTENKRLCNNQKVLLDSVKKYIVNDSLNTAKVNALELTNSELKKYIVDDVKIIKKLKTDKPETIIRTVTETITDIKVELQDTIIYRDTLKQINYNTKWISIIGYIFKDTANLKIKNNEELLLVESKQKKKFLFIKLPIWLFGYKAKSLDVVSKNPNTTITNIQYIQICN